MYTKYWVGIWATVIAVIFIFLTSLFPKYATLCFSIEVILLPMIYYIGYEVLVDKQKREFEHGFGVMHNETKRLSEYAMGLEKEIKRLKYLDDLSK
ncbi:hypothetical protein HOA92_03410 [archaeon]|jgi:hypothetical protein|nr:hypothetical protein [archaeon]MBT6762059.1 hypothetical protein [archaeon]